MFDLVAEILYYAVDSLYMQLYSDLLTFWDSVVPGFNPGQTTLYFRNMEGLVYEWLDEAQDSWPEADADYYADNLMSAYHSEVMERAFSDVIWEPVDSMWEIIYQAQELYEIATLLEAMSFL